MGRDVVALGIVGIVAMFLGFGLIIYFKSTQTSTVPTLQKTLSSSDIQRAEKILALLNEEG